jgi:large subunit ribosomal protein L18
MPKKIFVKNYKRKEKTDYGKRLDLLKSDSTRFVVRLSSKNMVAQLINYEPEGDKIVCAVSTKTLEKLGWKGSRTCLPAAYLLGFLIAKKASGKVKSAILDIGKRRSILHSKIYATLKGAIDGGLNIPAQESIFPSPERIKGEHIKNYAEKLLKENKEKYDKVFSFYIKNNIKPEKLPDHFQDIKSNIEGAK